MSRNHRFNGIAALTEPRLDLIRQRTELLRSLAHEAERRVATVNAVVADVSQGGLVPNMAILGLVIQTRSYPSIAGPRSSGQVLQAALLVPSGIGVVYWDSEDFAELSRVPDELEEEAALHFTGFDDSEPEIRGLIACQVDSLVEQFLQVFEYHRGIASPSH